MAWRALSDTVRQSESLASLTDLGERLYWRLLAHSDSYGRIAGSPPKTRAECFPLLEVSHEEVGAALSELEAVGRIWLYVQDEIQVIQITNFDTHQPKDLIRKRGTSRLPESPTLKFGEVTDLAPAWYGPRAPQGGPRAAVDNNSPANQHKGRTRAPLVGPRAAQSREEESRREEKSSSTRAQDDAEQAAAALLERLDALGLNGRTREQALAEPDRATAWIDLAQTEAKSNQAGFVRTGIQTGEWPSVRTPKPTRETKLALAMTRARQRIEDDWHRLDRIGLDIELNELGIPAYDRGPLYEWAAQCRPDPAPDSPSS